MRPGGADHCQPLHRSPALLNILRARLIVDPCLCLETAAGAAIACRPIHPRKASVPGRAGAQAQPDLRGRATSTYGGTKLQTLKQVWGKVHQLVDLEAATEEGAVGSDGAEALRRRPSLKPSEEGRVRPGSRLVQPFRRLGACRRPRAIMCICKFPECTAKLSQMGYVFVCQGEHRGSSVTILRRIALSFLGPVQLIPLRRAMIVFPPLRPLNPSICLTSVPTFRKHQCLQPHPFF